MGTAQVPRELRGPFRGSEAVRRGLLTRWQLGQSPWRRLWRDVYMLDHGTPDHLTQLRGLMLVMPAGAVASGRSAALVHGVDVLRHNGPLEVTIRRDVPLTPRQGVSVRHGELLPEDVVTRDGLPSTTPIRTAFDLARRNAKRGDLTEQVVAVDALSGPGERFSPDELVGYACARRFAGWRNVRQVAQVARLAEPLAGSPEESRLRMRLVRGGLPRPVAQYQVDVPGRRFFLDLAYPDFLVAIEYDGECHAEQREADADRHNRITAQGWTRFVFTRTLYRPGAPDPVAQVRRALIERGWRPH